MTEAPTSTPSSTPQPPPADDGVTLPRVPWSVVGPEFISIWGYPAGRFDPEHVEILGPSGSGKTYFDATILSERVKARDSAVVFVATKPADKTILDMGWPIVDDWAGVEKNRQSIYWPRTDKIGQQRDAYLHDKLADLLHHLWVKDSNTIVAFDEIATIEDLGRGPNGMRRGPNGEEPVDLKRLIKMYWREARSMGITIVAMKQRPQGAQRDMHSESVWVASFKPKDEDDGKRYAEVLGGRRKWLPVLEALDRDKHEFILANSRTGQAVISWVDVRDIGITKKKEKSATYNQRSA